MIRCAKCGALKRHSDMPITWQKTDPRTGRVIETSGLCKACHAEEHKRFREELKDPNSKASKILKGIMQAVASGQRPRTRTDD